MDDQNYCQAPVLGPAKDSELTLFLQIVNRRKTTEKKFDTKAQVLLLILFVRSFVNLNSYQVLCLSKVLPETYQVFALTWVFYDSQAARSETRKI